VRTHARNIYRKLGISTRRDLARLSRPDSGPVSSAGIVSAG
jgi:DNA-binding NarL/FixJ family response regulator